MWYKGLMGCFLIFLSLVALGFLVYTLTHLTELKITIFHPRVLIEFGLFAVFMVLGMWFC
jgi:hypothetical protein